MSLARAFPTQRSILSLREDPVVRASAALDLPEPLAAGQAPLIVAPQRPSGETLITSSLIGGVYSNSANVAAALNFVVRLIDYSAGPSVTNTGSIWNAPTSVVPLTTVRSVLDFTKRGTLDNQGLIVIDTLYGSVEAVRVNDSGSVTNSGVIFARTASEGHATGLHTFGALWSPAGTFGMGLINNSGQIAASAVNGVATGVHIEQGSWGFTNTGSVLAEGASAIGVFFDTFVVSPRHFTIVNSGTIEARSTSDLPSIGVVFVNRQNLDFTLTNSGVIRGDYAVIGDGWDLKLINTASGVLDGAVAMSFNHDEVENAGEITGPVFMEMGDDSLLNTGRIRDDVFAGEGNDVVDTTGGRIEGVVDLGFGHDAFRGSAFGDRVGGGFLNDELEGRDGDDLLMGGPGSDVLTGGAGRDGLYGELGDDRILTEDADVAYGGDGNDRFESLDLGFLLVDGGAGFDHWRVPETAAPLSLSAVLASSRLRHVESLGVHEDSSVVVRAGDVTALAGSGPLFIAGYADGTFGPGATHVTLVGTWTEGPQVTERGATWRSFSSGAATVLVPTGLSEVTIQAAGPANETGLAPVSPGATPPAPGEASGLDYSATAAIVDRYQLQDGERVSEGETWISSDGGAVIVSEWPIGYSIGNDGTLISNGADWVLDPLDPFERHAITVHALNASFFDNAGEIFTTGVRQQATFGILSTWAQVANTGLIEVTAEGGAAIGVLTTVSPDDPLEVSIFNAGTVSAYSAGHTAIALDAGNGRGVVNTGTLVADGALGAVGLGAGVQLDSLQLELSGVVYGGAADTYVNSGYIRAATTSAEGAPSAGIMLGFILSASTGPAATVRNEGIVEADHAVEGVSSRGDLVVENSGELRGDVVFSHYRYPAGDYASGGALILTNSGLIDGDVDTREAQGLVTFSHQIANSGTITGEIRLGAFADHYEATASGKAGAVHGYDGDDVLQGGAHEDRLFGGNGDDTLTGGLGSDRIDGGHGIDVLIVSGGASNYRLLGDGDGFVLKGADGSDRLANVEIIRFGDGSVLELNRMYGATADGVIPADLLDGGPQVLPEPGGGAEGGKAVDEPEVLPGASFDKAGDAFVLPAVPDDQPLVLPGLEAEKFAGEPLVLPGDNGLAGQLQFDGRAAHLPPTGDWMITLDPDGGLMGPQRWWGDGGM